MIWALLTSFWAPLLGCTPPNTPDQSAVEARVPISPLPAVAEPAPKVHESQALLAEIDAMLTQVDGKRVPVAGHFCQGLMPFGENRNSLCDHASLLGSWTLWGPHPGSPNGVEVVLSQYRFKPEQRQRALDRIFAQVGMGAGGDNGGISWCHAQATWQDETLWGLERSCSVSEKVSWVKRITALLRMRASHERGAVGVVGRSGGWAALVDVAGRPLTLPSAQTQRLFVRVVQVADNDVLWVRHDKPSAEQTLPAKIGSLAPDARCVPLQMRPPGDWLLITQSSGEPGWASARYLEEEAPGACEGG